MPHPPPAHGLLVPQTTDPYLVLPLLSCAYCEQAFFGTVLGDDLRFVPRS